MAHKLTRKLVLENKSPAEVLTAVAAACKQRQSMFDGYATLSPAELRLFDHMREKEFNRESAAHAMGISIKTADIHWTNIRKKLSTGLNIVSSSQVVYFAALFDVTTAVSVETAIGEAEEGS